MSKRDDDIDPRADFAIDEVWREMDDFLRWCAAEGKPQTQEDRRSDEFIALMKRCSAKAYKIISRLDSAAPHLSVVKDDDAPD